MAMKRQRLTDAYVAKLTPADREYTVWDTRQTGPRRAGAAVGASKLHPTSEGRGRRTQDHAGICDVDERREGARQVFGHRD